MSSEQVLQQIRAELRALKEQKLGLEGMRSFMDSGADVFDFPAGTRFEPFDADGIKAERVFLGETAGKRTLLLCHGGGYNVGSTLSHRPLASLLARACNAVVITFNFRLAPEHKFPCALEDAVTVYRYLLTFLGQPPALVGDSGGASLAFALALRLRELQLPMPAALVGLSAWLDFACEGNTFEINKPKDPSGNRGGLRMMAIAYAGHDNLKNPLVSPLYAESLAGLPPVLLQVGTAETLLDDSRRFARKATADGVKVTLQEWPDMIHVWHSFYSRLPEARQAIAAIGHWLDQTMSG